MVHIRPPCVHHWHLSTCPTAAPRIVSWHRSNRCQVSVARRWRFASHQLLMQISCKCAAFSNVQRVWNHWAPYYQLDLWLVTTLCQVLTHLSFSPRFMPKWFPSFWTPYETHGWWALHEIPAWRKLSPTDYRHITLISSMPGYQPWCHSRTEA
jgi:hypothetical protein